MLTGAPPFRGETALTIAVKHINEEPAPLQEIRPDLPLGLVRIIQRMMAKKVDARYKSGAEIIKDLKKVAVALDANAPPPSSAEIVLAQELRPSPSTAVRRSLPLTGAWKVLDRTWRDQAKIFLPLCIAAGLVFAAVGWGLRPRNPLRTRSQPPVVIAMQKTPFDQYTQALSMQPNERAWKAVIEYFPNDKTYTPEARNQLGQMYLLQDRLEEAEEEFKTLATAYGSDQKWRAIGLTGQAFILSLQAQFADSESLLKQVTPIREELSHEMEGLFTETQARNQERHAASGTIQ
jgi:serine/threonine-protein kinase